MGKQRLARLLGVRTPTSRRLQERFRGETQGHGTHPDCVRVRQIKAVHPEWGAHRIAQALAISIDHAKLHLARYLGAQSGATQAAASRMGTPLPDGIPVQTELPADGSELQDTTQGDARDLSYRGTQIRSVDARPIPGMQPWATRENWAPKPITGTRSRGASPRSLTAQPDKSDD